MRIFFALLISALTLFVSCKEEENDPVFIVPTDLQVEVTVATNGSGQVTVNAAANNAFHFDFYFGESSTEEALRADDGVAVYTYSASGNYTIEVRALGNGKEYLSYSTDIEIEKEGLQVDIWIPSKGYITPISYSGMSLFWQDEFSATTLNTEYWNYEIGTGGNGWGNNELQYYREENTSIVEGHLVIEAKKETFGGRNYTSSRLTTQNKLDFQYGRVDIRAALPQGQGIWPALWMLGSNFETVSWPACGEIDIMEMIGGGSGRDDTTHGTVHWDQNGHADFGGSKKLSSGIFYDEFHVFSIEWTSQEIRWFLDDQQFHTISTTPEALSEFRNDFFFIFNVAVGGNWPGSPDNNTVFPQRMVVDYVRVFQNN